MFPEVSAGSRKSFSKRKTRASFTEVGEDPEWGRCQRTDSGREGGQEKRVQAKAGTDGGGGKGVPSLRSDGEDEGTVPSWGRGALRNDRTQQAEGQVAEPLISLFHNLFLPLLFRVFLFLSFPQISLLQIVLFSL